jgi:hypothetical protein
MRGTIFYQNQLNIEIYKILVEIELNKLFFESWKYRNWLLKLNRTNCLLILTLKQND